MPSIRCLALWSAFLYATATAQSIAPSNSSESFPRASYPHFHVSASSSEQFPSFEVAPLAQYAAISRSYFTSINLKGQIVEINPGNVDSIRSHDILYISCDPEDYAGPIGPVELITIIGNMNVKNNVIFYTRIGQHCEVSGFMSNYLPRVSSIHTTLDPVVAGQLADLDFNHASGTSAVITADQDAFTNPNSPFYSSGSIVYETSTSTAVAMIVLYSITGIITALFVSIIVTGAVRAHLHPERYGPRANTNFRGGQSRAKGIARAVLETIPIVKFGDHHKGDIEKKEDVEMKTSSPQQKELAIDVTKSSSAEVTDQEKSAPLSPSNADGSDELGVLGCSICTEEFKQGEEVRVLPCNHKYHPDCVDPWLLNVSGTCPLCRIDLRKPEDDNAIVDPIMVIPASTSNMQALRSAITGTRDERIAALRRFRAERRYRGETQRAQDEEERRSLARRLTDRFRIRTREHQVSAESTSPRRT